MNVDEKGINRFNLNRIDPEHRLRSLMMRSLTLVPDALYLRLMFRIRTGRTLDLDHPTTFCDKTNWLKLHDRHEEYTRLVDKLAVREHVEARIGKEHLFPLLGAWDSFDEIDFGALPRKFVLKCNHDSGSVRIIEDKTSLTREKLDGLRRHFSRSLNGNPFYAGREYPYRNVRARILAEAFMANADGTGIRDYKFFCFNGTPKILFVATDRKTDCRFDFFDMDFRHLDIVNIHPQADKPVAKPQSFEEMKRIAAVLSEGMRFSRIDLYDIDGRVYFGEYTFFHAGGFWPMTPDVWERRLGEWIDLND